LDRDATEKMTEGENDIKTTSHFKSMVIPSVGGPIGYPPSARISDLVSLLLTCSALSRTAQAICMGSDGGYSAANAARREIRDAKVRIQ